MSKLTLAGLGERIGHDWVAIDQAGIDTFASCTGDRQWIHVDVERAKRESPFRGPTAHGYLRECVDHIIVSSEIHLRRVSKSYTDYYNSVRTHLSLNKDAPVWSPRSANRYDRFAWHTGRTSSPLRPCLSFRYTQAYRK